MDDKYQLQFVWPYREPSDVVVTGDFDGWNSTVHLKRTERGFEATVPVDWNSKIRFKFRTDGWWTTIANFPTEVDDLGNVNNITFTPEKPVAKPNGVHPTKEVIEAKEVTPAIPEAPVVAPEVVPAPPVKEESKQTVVDAPSNSEVVPPVEASTEPATSEISAAAPITNGTPLESDKVDKEHPVAEEPEVAPVVPIAVQPVADKEADTNDAKPAVDEVVPVASKPEETSVPVSTHTPAPVPEPEPVSAPEPVTAPEPEPVAEVKEDAQPQPIIEVTPAPKAEETPAPAPEPSPVPAPTPEVTEPKPEETVQPPPVAEAEPAAPAPAPIPAEVPKVEEPKEAPKEEVPPPSTPPKKSARLPDVPSTPVKAVNGTAPSVPSTPHSGPTVSASAPATPAGKLAFPGEGKDEGGSVRSLKEGKEGGRHKHRLSFFDKIKAKLHIHHHHHHHDGDDSPKENGKKEKEKEEKERGSIFHRRSSSKY